MTQAQGMLRPCVIACAGVRRGRRGNGGRLQDGLRGHRRGQQPRRRGSWSGCVRRTSPASIGATMWRRLARRGNVAEASVNPTGLRRGEDTAGQLEALRDAMRRDETGAEGEVTSISRVPELDETVPELGDTASVHEASALDIVGDIGSEATVPGMDAPVLPSTVSPPQPPPGVKTRTPRRRRPSASVGGVGAHIFQGQFQTAQPSGPLRQIPQLGHGRGRRGCARAHLR